MAGWPNSPGWELAGGASRGYLMDRDGKGCHPPRLGGRVSAGQAVDARLGYSADVGGLTPAPAGGIRPTAVIGGTWHADCNES